MSSQFFEKQLNSFGKESRNAARYLYTDLALQHGASQSKLVLERLNETPMFWLVTSAALQTAAYMSLGRIFDCKSAFNVENLLKAAESNLQLFQRVALMKRKLAGQTQGAEWLDDYLDNAYYPEPSDLIRIRNKVDKHRAIYNLAVKPARNKYFAHREKQDQAEVSALFGSGKVGDLVQVATFLLQLDDIFWQLLHNGRRPVFRRVRKSVAAMRTASRTGSQAHEEVTRETYSLLKLIEEAPAWVA